MKLIILGLMGLGSVMLLGATGPAQLILGSFLLGTGSGIIIREVTRGD